MRDRIPRLCGLAAALLVTGGPAMAQAPGTGSGPAQDSAASASAAAVVTPDYADLNPAFLLTPGECSGWIAEGRKMASKGKKFDNLAREYRRTPSWTRGKHGRADASVWCYTLNGGYVKLAAYRAATLYEKSSIPEYLISTGGWYRTLNFDVVLASEPKIGKDQTASILAGLAAELNPGNAAQYTVPDQVLREADPADVTALKFVLSDDKGNNYTADAGSTSGRDLSGTMTYSGFTPVHTYESGTTTGAVSAYAYGDGGSASAVASGSATSTFTRTEFVPYTQEHRYYRASYTVSFPLFDEQGHPRITPDVKTLTLHIVTEGGEMSVVYKLADKRR